jgi:predicted nucleotidyltransferase
MSIDLSHKPELAGLAQVVQALEGVTRSQGIDAFLMGAAARDLLLVHTGVVSGVRATEDVDFGVMVHDWTVFESMRAALIEGGQFVARPGPATHRLRHRNGLPLDIVPFGGVERADRTLAWPPGDREIFDCFGMREALQDCVMVRLPGGIPVRAASVPAQALLKLAAWSDRKHTHPGRDAGDLFLLCRKHLDFPGNMERAASEHGDLFDQESFDHEDASVRLLARDMAGRLDAAGLQRVIDLVVAEADETGRLLLASQSGLALGQARRLIEVLSDELTGLSTQASRRS